MRARRHLECRIVLQRLLRKPRTRSLVIDHVTFFIHGTDDASLSLRAEWVCGGQASRIPANKNNGSNDGRTTETGSHSLPKNNRDA
jgi:hypothetical protein